MSPSITQYKGRPKVAMLLSSAQTGEKYLLKLPKILPDESVTTKPYSFTGSGDLT